MDLFDESVKHWTFLVRTGADLFSASMEFAIRFKIKCLQYTRIARSVMTLKCSSQVAFSRIHQINSRAAYSALSIMTVLSETFHINAMDSIHLYGGKHTVLCTFRSALKSLKGNVFPLR